MPMNFTRNVLTVICENMVILYGFFSPSVLYGYAWSN